MIKTSIIVPTFNSQDFIKRALLSIFSQSNSSWELILIDDCSTDNTLMEVKSVISETTNPFTIIKNAKNLGADVTRNIGIEHAKGEYIAFLDSDDYWNSEKLQIQVAYMENSGSLCSCTAYIIHGKNGNKFLNSVSNELNQSDILKNNTISTSTVIYNSKKMGKVFFPNIPRGQDLALWLKIIDKAGKIDGINQPLSNYSRRPGSLSSNKIKSAIWVWILYRKYIHLSIFKASYFFIFYAINGIRKALFLRKMR